MSCCGHGHEHTHIDETGGAGGSTLLASVDTDGVRCLNERELGSCRNIFRAWEERDASVEESEALLSDEDDPELLLFVPFTVQVRLRAFTLIGGSELTTPIKCKIYVNRDDLDFSSVADLSPVQEFDLISDPNAAKDVEYPVKARKFMNVSSVTLHFPDASGADYSQINFLSFRGDATQNKREAVTTVYESKPMLKDHKTRADTLQGHMLQ